MRTNRFVLTVVLAAMFLTMACSPWIKAKQGEPIHTFLDIPMDEIHAYPEKHIGMVFEDRFKFYRIYHDKETADPSKREQTIRGETHFTARPIQQYLYVIRIRITPHQEKWINKKGIRRQDAIKARVRFAGIAPNGNAAFDLLEILE
jgi:hypothetical protein